MSLLTMKNILIQNSELVSGQSLVSDNGRFFFNLETSGNLVLFNLKVIEWSSNTANIGSKPYRLKMQNDGNLVLYDSNNLVIWKSNTVGKGTPSYHFAIQGDGNAVIYGSTGAIWSSKHGVL